MADLDLNSAHGHELARQLGITLAASEKLDAHLTASIEALTPVKKGNPMRGLARLSNLTETLIKDMDAKADAVADRLVAAKGRHEATLSKFEDFTASVERVADEAEAALGQISNLPPSSA